MWLLTVDRFYSIVQKHGESSLCARARAREDLERLGERYLPTLTETHEAPHADYRHRAWVARENFAIGLQRVARDVRYRQLQERRRPG